MEEAERLDKIMEELGPVMPEVTTVAQLEEHEWVVVWQEDAVVSLHFDSRDSFLHFSLHVGVPESEQRLSAYEALLMYNFLGISTGGVRMSLDGPGGMVVQEYGCASRDIDLTRIQGILRGFVTKGYLWREMLASGTFSVPDGPEQIQDPPGIRV